ncbi:MAG TPA: hypothetical protein DIT10_21565 [Chryseobacterium sp.]|nr:hypothetical protein [Chryseobacterium sp.]
MNENELSYKIIGAAIEVIPRITRNNKMIGNEYKKKLFNAKFLITDYFIFKDAKKSDFVAEEAEGKTSA